MLYLDLTYRCNLRCLFCASNRTNSAATEGYHVDGFSALFAAHAECGFLHISGGEPTLCDSLINLCTEARSRFDYVLLSTNGLRCADRGFAAELLSTGLDCVVVPFLTSNEAVHDRLVGRPGAFGDLVRGLRNLTQLRDPQRTTLLIKVLLTRPGADGLECSLELWSRSGIAPDEVQISGLHLSEQVLAHRELILDGVGLSEIASSLVKTLATAGIPFSICDLPWCLLEDEALSLLLLQGNLHRDTLGREYTKIYDRGIRRATHTPYRFPQCDGCEVIDFCDSYYFQNIGVLEPALRPSLRRIRFEEKREHEAKPSSDD